MPNNIASTSILQLCKNRLPGTIVVRSSLQFDKEFLGMQVSQLLVALQGEKDKSVVQCSVVFRENISY